MNSIIKNNKVLMMTCMVFSFIFYGLGYRVIYQPDIYGRVTGSIGSLSELLLDRDGRILNVLIMYLIYRGTFVFVYYISLIVSIFLITIATYKFSVLLVSEYERVTRTQCSTIQLFFTGLISCLSIANMFSVEFFVYIDMAISFSLGILCTVMAAILFIRSLTEPKKRIVWSILVELVIVAFLYETISSLFIVLTVPFIVLYATSFAGFVRKQVFAGVYYAVPLLAKTVFTKFIINSDRAQFDKSSFADAVKQYMPKGSNPSVFILDRITFGMWWYMILSMAVIVLILCHVIKNRQYVEIVKGLYISLVIIIVSMIPFILRLTNDYKPRIYYPLGAFFGVICIYGVMSGNINTDIVTRNIGKIVLSVTIILMTSIQWLSFVQMYVDCYITNYEDKYISEMIGAYIDRYEKENGVNVENVVFYDDMYRTKYSIEGWDLTERVYSAWYEREALNLYLDRQFGVGKPDAEIADYFYSHNWDCFSDELVIIKGNTAHICGY